jgi:hypothetical protein
VKLLYTYKEVTDKSVNLDDRGSFSRPYCEIRGIERYQAMINGNSAYIGIACMPNINYGANDYSLLPGILQESEK